MKPFFNVVKEGLLLLLLLLLLYCCVDEVVGEQRESSRLRAHYYDPITVSHSLSLRAALRIVRGARTADPQRVLFLLRIFLKKQRGARRGLFGVDDDDDGNGH